MRKWTIIGLEGLSDDFGCCEPDAAATDIALRIVHGQQLSERDIEDIANRYGCRVEWSDQKLGEG